MPAAFYMIVFAGALGVAPAAMKPEVSAGPFPTEQVCYAAAALGLDKLNATNPDRDFRVTCRRGNGELVRVPGERLYDLQESVAKAELTL